MPTPSPQILSFGASVVSLFLIMNAVGNIPLFIKVLSRYDSKRQRRILLREMVTALIILLIFAFFGVAILQALDISQSIMRIVGGILLFVIALAMIFPREEQQEIFRHEPFIFPLAFPVVAGPGVITTVMVFADQVQNNAFMTAAIFTAWAASVFVLLSASFLAPYLGQRGLLALEKLGGLLISLLAVNMLAVGIIQLIKAAFPH